MLDVRSFFIRRLNLDMFIRMLELTVKKKNLHMFVFFFIRRLNLGMFIRMLEVTVKKKLLL